MLHRDLILVHHAILGVINSAVPVVNVQPGFVAGPQPGGVSAFAAATHQQGPQGSGFSAQTGVSGPSGRN